MMLLCILTMVKLHKQQKIFVELAQFQTMDFCYFDHCNPCSKCYNNYYVDGSECKTCSQINEGCNSCNSKKECKECKNGYELNNNTCNKVQTLTCSELNPHCELCDNSNSCTNCSSGYYLAIVNNNPECVKCLSTCEECESLNKCTKCKEGMILKDGECVSCFSEILGCEKCYQNGNCYKCYKNDTFKYKLNDSKCILEEGKDIINNNEINLKFQRIDSYEQEDNKIYFRPHFILLNNFIFNSKLHLKIKLIWNIFSLRYLRELDQKEEDIEIDCSQYGDSLGNNNKGGYLVNYKCSIDDKDGYKLSSIDPIEIEIFDKNNNQIEKLDFDNKVININDLQSTSLDEEYEKFSINKVSLTEISDINLEENILSFKIIGDFDSKTSSSSEYEITLKKENNNEIKATCNIPIVADLSSQSIDCTSNQTENNDKLTFEENIYSSKTNNNEKLILNNKDGVTIEVPAKKSLSVGAIIGIVIAGIILIGPFIYFIIKFLAKKEDLNEGPRDNGEVHKRYRNADNSKDNILG